jgi:integrase
MPLARKACAPKETAMLTVAGCRNARYTPAGKHKLFDGGGLYLEIHANGSKYWRLKYRYAGKERRLALGVFPAVSLAEARNRRDDARRLLRDGIDPASARTAVKAQQAPVDNTFGAVAAEWLRRREQHEGLAEVTTAKTRWFLSLAEALNDKPAEAITAPDVLMILRKLEENGNIDTAHRVKQKIGQVLRYAVATGRAQYDVTAALRGALVPLRHKHRAALTKPAEAGRLLRAIETHRGQPTTRAALQLSALTFVRPGELRRAEWSEIDLDACEWRIPAEKMKMRAAHIVPLSRQATAILRALQPLTGSGRYVFPSLRGASRCMSENTVNVAIRDLGFGPAEMTAHGFRSMASTLLNEQGWNRDAIERQLAHAERDTVRAAYNYAEHLPERRKMMQAWADYLDRLRSKT